MGPGLKFRNFVNPKNVQEQCMNGVGKLGLSHCGIHFRKSLNVNRLPVS